MKIVIYSHTNYAFGGGIRSTSTLYKNLSRKYSVRIIKCVASLTKEIKDYMPDVIIHTNIADLFNVYKVATKNKIPFIPIINGNIYCMTGLGIKLRNSDIFGKDCTKCNLFNSIACTYDDYRYNLWQKAVNSVSLMYRYPRLKLRIKALNKSAAVICIGKTLARLLRKNGVKNTIRIIPQPISEKFFKIAKNKSHTTNKIILGIGTTTKIKGFEILVNAFRKLKTKKSLHLCIVGKMKFPYNREFLNYPADKNIKLINFVKEDLITEYLKKAYIAIFPAIWFEPFGRAWAESIATGTPVIAFKGRGGASDYLTNMKNCLLVDFSIDQLAAAMDRLLNDIGLYNRLSANGKKFARENLHEDIVAEKLLGIIKDCIKS